VSAWWGSTVGSLAEGDTFEVGFGSSRRIVMVATSVGSGHVEWRVTEAPHTPEWAETTIVFDVAPADAGAELRFRHDGLTPQLECFAMCQEGWTHYLASLIAWVTTGEGHPYRTE
jgi:Activator of Hsp90 ATPase homolog 1-like protein